jgi:DNA-binding transcriptional regulator YdaS (Cro superfamily)
MRLDLYLKGQRGRAKALAVDLGVSASLVIQWVSGKQVAIEWCPSIEKATQGEVTCADLRPDHRWVREADVLWPWHKDGRPLLDLARLPARQLAKAA